MALDLEQAGEPLAELMQFGAAPWAVTSRQLAYEPAGKPGLFPNPATGRALFVTLCRSSDPQERKFASPSPQARTL